jgi:mycoredoxin
MPAPIPAPVIVYSTPWCGHCHRLMRQLDREQITYVEVDIEQRPEAAQVVMAVNDGQQTVPTLVFPDGTTLSNPSAAQVRAHLAARET